MGKFPWVRSSAKYSALILLASLTFTLISNTADASSRSLKLYYLHTGEKATITYKRNGKFIPAGLNRLNRFLRDWRRNEPTKMDPNLFDLVWEVYRQSGSHAYIHVISGYRSLKTNNMLRKRGRGVAKKSQHTLGKAMDFFLPDVKLAKLRKIGLIQQVGGVGYYPRSGSPFVHMDTGRVRHWPRMTRKELVRVFPNGKTLHIPSDGKPLPGYNQAVAAYNARSKNRKKIQFASKDEKERKNFFQRLAALARHDEAEDRGDNSPRIRSVKTLKPKADLTVAKDDTAAQLSEPAANLDTVEKDKQKALADVAIPVPNLAPRYLLAQIENQQQDDDALTSKTDPDSVLELAQQIPVPDERPQEFALAQLELKQTVLDKTATQILEPSAADLLRQRLKTQAQQQLRVTQPGSFRPNINVGESFATALLGDENTLIERQDKNRILNKVLRDKNVDPFTTASKSDPSKEILTRSLTRTTARPLTRSLTINNQTRSTDLITDPLDSDVVIHQGNMTSDPFEQPAIVNVWPSRSPLFREADRPNWSDDQSDRDNTTVNLDKKAVLASFQRLNHEAEPANLMAPSALDELALFSGEPRKIAHAFTANTTLEYIPAFKAPAFGMGTLRKTPQIVWNQGFVAGKTENQFHQLANMNQKTPSFISF